MKPTVSPETEKPPVQVAESWPRQPQPPPRPAREIVTFAGPFTRKGHVRTHIFGQYKPEASLFRGERTKRSGDDYYHQGVDVLAPRGTIVIAPADGVVVKAGMWDPRGYGIAILVRVAAGANPLYVLYAHLDQVLVGEGARVRRGQPIARTGKSGNAARLPRSEEHVHIEVRTQEVVGPGLAGRLDPLPYFPNIAPP